MAQASAVRHNGNVQAIDSTLVLDREQLRDITMCDEDLMREIVAALIDDTSRQLQLFAVAVRDQDQQRCARLAHYSKGACANVGANRAAALFRSLERRAKEGDFRDCGHTLEELAGEIELLRNEAI